MTMQLKHKNKILKVLSTDETQGSNAFLWVCKDEVDKKDEKNHEEASCFCGGRREIIRAAPHWGYQSARTVN